jgi:hypothetical protein
MVDIMTALATASQALKLAQDLRGIDKAVNEADFKLKIADLTIALSDIKLTLSEAKDELASKQSEIDALKAQFARMQETVEVGGFKYRKGEDGKPRGRAFCPVCEQKQGKLFHIAQVLHTQVCPSCKAYYSEAKVFAD